MLSRDFTRGGGNYWKFHKFPSITYHHLYTPSLLRGGGGGSPLNIDGERKLTTNLEKIFDSLDDTGCVDGLRLEVLHYFEESFVNVWLVSKLHFDLIKIKQSIFNLELSATLCVSVYGRNVNVRDCISVWSGKLN